MTRMPFRIFASASAFLRLLVLTGLVASIGGLGQPVTTVHASVLTLVVDRTDDPTAPIPSNCTAAANDCSLRGAIITANANPGSTVRIAHGATYTLSIAASGPDDAKTGDLNITTNMDLAYPPGICLFNCQATIEGEGWWFDRIISIGASATVHMPGIIIRNGHPLSGDGGGISNWGALTFNGATLTENSASRGGGIFNIGILTLTNSAILTNTASSQGGGLHNNYPGTTILSNTVVMGNTGPTNGGGVENEGTMTIMKGTIKSNSANAGGGIASLYSLTVSSSTVMSNTASNGAGGGILASSGIVALTDTTISGNTSKGPGGGIYTYGSATLTNVTVTNNKALTTNYLSDGGGIVSYSGNLTVTGSTVSGNSTENGRGGGIHFFADSFAMTSSTVENNSSQGSGGGLYLYTKTSSIKTSTIKGNSANSTDFLGGGGILLVSGALTITDSVISNNGASGDTVTAGGGLANNYADMTVQRTTISGNHAPNGGIYNAGTLTITDSTVSGNTALTGKGGGLHNNGIASVYNSTIANNSAPGGSAGGIYASATVKLRDTLVAGNTSPSSPDCGLTLVSLGHNLLGISWGCFGLTNGVNGDRVGSLAAPLDPKIGPLANNGGSNYTHALLAGSPAIDGGDPIPATCPATDQRGIARPIYAVCDIGAFEYRGPDMYLPLIVK